MNYTIYNPQTGQILSVLSSNDPTQLNIIGQVFIEGNYPGDQYYIDQGQPTLLPQKPNVYLQEYTFNWTTKTWDLDQAQTAQNVIARRNILLNQNVDIVNPIWYNSLTQEQQQELAAYRQALLNVPQQAGFPDAVVWPTPPSFV